MDSKEAPKRKRRKKGSTKFTRRKKRVNSDPFVWAVSRKKKKKKKHPRTASRQAKGAVQVDVKDEKYIAKDAQHIIDACKVKEGQKKDVVGKDSPLDLLITAASQVQSEQHYEADS